MKSLKHHETQSAKSVSKDSDSIPVDLLIDIFSRVTGKSIAKFRCVSKLWESIPRLPYFTELFLTKSYTRPRIFFALEANHKLFFFSSPQKLDENSFLVATRYYTSFPKYFPYEICSTVCGLVLLQGYGKVKVLVICNPATGEFITLPKVLIKEKNLPKVKGKSNPTNVAGMYLGYDPLGKQFKVLCMTSSRDECPNTHYVLTLEPGKRVWRAIEECKFHFSENDRISGDICIDGVLYLGDGFGPVGKSSVIICFDVRSEKFVFIETAEGMDVGHSLTLFNYKGKLGAHPGSREVGLWVLEDAAKHKWVMHVWIRMPTFVNSLRFVGIITGTCELVWSSYSDDDFYIYFYNPKRNNLTRLNVQGFEEFKHHQRLVINTFLEYVENMKFIT